MSMWVDSGRFFAADEDHEGLDLNGSYVGEVIRCAECRALSMGESEGNCDHADAPFAVYVFSHIEHRGARLWSEDERIGAKREREAIALFVEHLGLTHESDDVSRVLGDLAEQIRGGRS